MTEEVKEEVNVEESLDPLTGMMERLERLEEANERLVSEMKAKDETISDVLKTNRNLIGLVKTPGEPVPEPVDPVREDDAGYIRGYAMVSGLTPRT